MKKNKAQAFCKRRPPTQPMTASEEHLLRKCSGDWDLYVHSNYLSTHAGRRRSSSSEPANWGWTRAGRPDGLTDPRQRRRAKLWRNWHFLDSQYYTIRCHRLQIFFKGQKREIGGRDRKHDTSTNNGHFSHLRPRTRQLLGFPPQPQLWLPDTSGPVTLITCTVLHL